MTKPKFVIAIDGYSSCGKSTLAKQLADKLNFAYVDSGAMYRAITVYLLDNQLALDDNVEIEKALNLIKIRFEVKNGANLVFLNGLDVSEKIREMNISNTVSKISPIKAVRTFLVQAQQEIGRHQSIIMDGRDIGTKVFPLANVKLFMTADLKKRAERRHLELHTNGQFVSIEEVSSNLFQRDHDDTTRAESPLTCAEDAIVIDNTNLSMEEQFKLAFEIINSSMNDL